MSNLKSFLQLSLMQGILNQIKQKLAGYTLTGLHEVDIISIKQARIDLYGNWEAIIEYKCNIGISTRLLQEGEFLL